MVSGIHFPVARTHAHILKISAPELMARNEPSSPDDDETLVSQAFKRFMNIQLTLIMFLVLCWLYDRVWSGPSGTSLK
jgi:hypothetical protein